MPATKPGGDHLTAETLANWATLPLRDQVQGAYHVSEACPECWTSIHSARLGQPLGHREPFLRALARIRLLPRVDLSLPSPTIRTLVGEPFRPRDFPSLLLRESIALALESDGPTPSGHSPSATRLDLPMELGELLGDSTATRTAGLDLQVNVHCARVQSSLRESDRASAEEALGRAKSQVDDRCDGATRVNVMLAELSWASGSEDEAAAVECANRLVDQGLPLLDDPVRRFEIRCEVIRGLHRVGAAHPWRNAAWPLAELDGRELELDHVIRRLNGLFHKARYAPAVAAQIPSFPQTVAAELATALASVKEHGDVYSFGLYHQLRGELDGDETAFDDALDIFAAVQLERPFFDAWVKFDRWLVTTKSPQLSERRNHLSKQAIAVFGKDIALPRIEALPWHRATASLMQRPLGGWGGEVPPPGGMGGRTAGGA